MSLETFSEIAIGTPAADDVQVADTTAAPEAPADPLAPFAEQYKLDRFKDVGSALDMFVAAGRPAPQAFAPAPAASVAPVDLDPLPTEDDDDEDLDVQPPVDKKPIRKTKREKALEKKLAAIEARNAQYEQQRQIAETQRLYQLEQEILGVVDSLGSKEFGVGANRDYGQIGAVRALVADAIAVSNGSAQFGTFIPLPDAIRMLAARAGVAPQSEKTSEKVGLEPRSLSGKPQAGQIGNYTGPPIPGGSLASYSHDPQYRAAVAQLLQKG